MKRVTTLILVICLFAYLKLYAQEIVVSEYFNRSGTAIGEWTELLVISDNTSLTGYVLRDNAATSDLNEWQGGVRFTGNALWQHLRAGTIIVVNHRGNLVVDDDADDGYVEISAENSTYFEKVVFCSGCTVENDWTNKALSIAEEEDMIQIIDAAGSHVHCLAHMTTPTGLWLTLPSPKSSRQGQIGGDGRSVRIVPGTSLAEYNRGFDTGNLYTAENSTNVTKGKPNNSTNSSNENQLFWRALRQPSWNSPALNASVAASTVNLSWNQCTDAYSADNRQGYLIFRIPAADSASASTPEDGKVYSAGAALGSAIVATNVSPSTQTSYTDNFSVPCGESYIYRVYSYRYNADPSGEDALPTNARGRSYNEENFAEVSVIKTNPRKPVLQLQSYCDSTLLSVSSPTGNFTYEWTIDAVAVPNSNYSKFAAVVDGTYRVKITDPQFNCTSTSDKYDVEIARKPVPELFFNDNKVFRDSSVKVCNILPVLLKTNSAESVQWFRNSEPVAGNTELMPDSDGIYFAVLTNKLVCSDSTSKLTIKFIEEVFTYDKDTLFYNLDKATNSGFDTLKLSNGSKDTLFISGISLPAKFQLIEPLSLSFAAPGSIVKIVVKYSSTQSEQIIDKLIITTFCGASDTIYLIASKEGAALSSSTAELDFPDMLICNPDGSEATFNVINTGSNDIVVYKPVVNSPFGIISPEFPITVVSNTSSEIKAGFYSNTAGNYSGIIKFPYLSGSEADTLKIELNGKVIEPSFEVSESRILLPELTSCEEYYDSLIVVKNTGGMEITVEADAMEDILLEKNSFIIQQNSEDTLRFRFQPSYEGNFTLFIHLTINPCGMEKTIEVDGSKTGSTYKQNKDTLDFGRHVKCSGNDEIKDSLILYVSGDANQKPKIKEFTISPPFSVNLAAGQELSDTNIIIITFPDSPCEKYYGELTITVEPCDKIITLYLLAEWTSFEIVMENNVVDFGSGNAPVNITRFLKIKNPAYTAMKIDSISGITPPFYFSMPQPIFPLIIESGDSALINFSYINFIASEDSNTATMYISEPCVSDTDFILKGETLNKDTSRLNLTLSIPEGYSQKPGDEFEISVMVSGDSDLSDSIMAETDISMLKGYMEYNPTLLYPLKIRLPEESPGTTTEKIVEITPGRLLFVIEYDSYLYFTENSNVKTLCNIAFKALLGNDSITALVLDSISFIAEKAVIFSLVNGSCGIVTPFLADPGEGFKFLTDNTSPVNDEIIFEFKIISDEKASLILYNLCGQAVETIFDGILPTGEYVYNFSTRKLAMGMYYAVLKNGIRSKVIKLLLLKNN